LKKVLIISPYFPPVNAADMQRIRMSLTYFKQFGLGAEVVTVNPRYCDFVKDDLLVETIPVDVKIYEVNAFSKNWTKWIGLGSIALRSLYFYYKKVNRLLKNNQYDLIYFSTTQFPVCVLGNYWNKRYHIPYVIDFQDPWHSDYYQNKPKHERPPKYCFSYRLNKFLEGIAMKRVGGLIAVTDSYISALKERYPHLRSVPSSVITFGAFDPDFKIAAKNNVASYIKKSDKISIAYVGVVGGIMEQSLTTLFSCLSLIKYQDLKLYESFEWFFIGTSYAPPGTGQKTVLPVAAMFCVDDCVYEQTDRITYYEALKTIMTADALLIIGSDEPHYTASKLYPYLLTQKPLLALFNVQSPALKVMDEYGAKYAYSYNAPDIDIRINDFLKELKSGQLTKQEYDVEAEKKYSAGNLTKRQCELFDQVME